MFRLFRYLPVVIPIAMKFFRSKQGKAIIAKVRSRTQGGGTGGAAPRR